MDKTAHARAQVKIVFLSRLEGMRMYLLPGSGPLDWWIVYRLL